MLGGVSVVNAKVLAGLQAAGYRVRALAPNTASSEADGEVFARTVDFPITWFTIANFSPEPRDTKAARRPDNLARCIEPELQGLLTRARPALILVGDENCAPAVAPLARHFAIPYLVIAHGRFVDILEGRYPRKLSELVTAALGQADLVVTVANHMADGLRQLGHDRIAVVANRVDTALFSPRPPSNGLRRQLGLNDEHLVVLHASNLRPVKRPMDLVAAATIALGLDARLRYVIVGDGPERAALQAAVRARGLEDAFRFPGHVPHAAMPDHVRLADIVALMSDREGLPLAALEGLAGGRALVMSDIPATRELIADGKTGIVYPLGDVEGLSAAILRLASAPALRARLGRRARAHAVATYDARSWGAAYAAAVESVLSGKTGAASTS